MPGTVRKLAREFVIFCLAGILVASAAALVVERKKIIAEKSPFGWQPTGFEPMWGPMVSRDTDDPVQRILLPLQLNDDTKTKTWHVFYEAKNDKDFEQRLQSLDLPNEVRSQLSSVSNNMAPGTKSLPWYQREDRPAASLPWEDVPRLLELTFVYGLPAGVLGGIVIWIFYRSIRFAILG